MRLLAGFCLVALAACSNAQETAATGEAEAAPGMEAPPSSAAEALITSLTWTGPGQEPLKGPLAPRDECVEVDGAYQFRLALAEAVIARNADALLALADPNIKLDFGGGEGRATLKERLAEPDRALWLELEKIMPLGCADNGQGNLILPWYFAQDFGDIDGFVAMLVTGEDVPLLKEPNADAEVLARLSWEAVELDPEMFDGELRPFARVKLGDGTSGWIAEESLRSQLDYRIVANRKSGDWKMIAFIAGD